MSPLIPFLVGQVPAQLELPLPIPVQQSAVSVSDIEPIAAISATTAISLCADALGLDPPPDALVYVWIEGGDFKMGAEDRNSDGGM